MKTAREEACKHTQSLALGLTCNITNGQKHSEVCDRLTTAIEARDAEQGREYGKTLAGCQAIAAERATENDRLRAALTVAREALEVIAPIKCYACIGIPDERAGCHHAVARRAVAALTDVT